MLPILALLVLLLTSLGENYADVNLDRISFGHRYQKHIASQYREKFGNEGATIEDFGIAYGLDPNQAAVGRLLNTADTAVDTVRYTSLGAAALATIGAVGVYTFSKGKANSLFTFGTLGGLSAAGVAGAAEYGLFRMTDTPNIMWLMGGANLFLQCLRNETIVAIPIMKNGTPITAGLEIADPEAMYKSWAGGINRWVEDSIEGTSDMIKHYSRHGSAAWDWDFLSTDVDALGPVYGQPVE